MTRAEARTVIRTATDQDVTTGPISDSALNTWIDLEHKTLRRKLGSLVPSLYTTVDSSQAISGSDDTLTLPSDYDRLVRLERQAGTTWYPVENSDSLTPHLGDLTFREEGATQALVLSPLQLAPGTYRIVYVAKPTTLSADSGAGGVLLVPDGCEEIITELVCARVRMRLEEDPSPHQANASRIWTEQKRALVKRYGRHPEPGLRIVRRW